MHLSGWGWGWPGLAREAVGDEKTKAMVTGAEWTPLWPSLSSHHDPHHTSKPLISMTSRVLGLLTSAGGRAVPVTPMPLHTSPW